MCQDPKDPWTCVGCSPLPEHLLSLCRLLLWCAEEEKGLQGHGADCRSYQRYHSVLGYHHFLI